MPDGESDFFDDTINFIGGFLLFNSDLYKLKSYSHNFGNILGVLNWLSQKPSQH